LAMGAAGFVGSTKVAVLISFLSRFGFHSWLQRHRLKHSASGSCRIHFILVFKAEIEFGISTPRLVKCCSNLAGANLGRP
jgi:hypothetical protein